MDIFIIGIERRSSFRRRLVGMIMGLLRLSMWIVMARIVIRKGVDWLAVTVKVMLLSGIELCEGLSMMIILIYYFTFYI